MIAAISMAGSEKPQDVMVLLSKIKIDADRFQTRAETDSTIVDVYAKRMKTQKFEPILLIRLPGGALLLADGFHRVKAAKRLRSLGEGWDRINAAIVDGTEEDAILAGLAANQAVIDRTLTKADRIHGAKVFLRNEKLGQLPRNVIAKMCGVAASTVVRLRASLTLSEGLRYPDTITRSDGRSYPARTGHREDLTPATSNRAGRPGRVNFLLSGETVDCRTEDAEAVMAAKAAEHAEFRAALDSNLHFLNFLSRRGIGVRLATKSESVIGGVIVAGPSAVCPIAETTSDAFLAAVGRLCILRARIPGVARLILVGFKNDIGAGMVASEALAALGIEFMTPREFLAEFTPKPDAEVPSKST